MQVPCDNDEELARMNDHRFNFAVLEIRDAINFFGLAQFVRDLVSADSGLATALMNQIDCEINKREYKGVLLAGSRRREAVGVENNS